jgi:hypothetical protein
MIEFNFSCLQTMSFGIFLHFANYSKFKPPTVAPPFTSFELTAANLCLLEQLPTHCRLHATCNVSISAFNNETVSRNMKTCTFSTKSSQLVTTWDKNIKF